MDLCIYLLVSLIWGAVLCSVTSLLLWLQGELLIFQFAQLSTCWEDGVVNSKLLTCKTRNWKSPSSSAVVCNKNSGFKQHRLLSHTSVDQKELARLSARCLMKLRSRCQVAALRLIPKFLFQVHHRSWKSASAVIVGPRSLFLGLPVTRGHSASRGLLRPFSHGLSLSNRRRYSDPSHSRPCDVFPLPSSSFNWAFFIILFYLSSSPINYNSLF